MLSSLLDSIPFVESDDDRNARYPNPRKNFRVQYSDGTIKRFTGAAWVVMPASSASLARISSQFLKGDSVTDDKAAFDTLVNVIMQPDGGELDVVGVPRIASNLVIPANILLRFRNGAYVAPDLGATVTILGPVDSTPIKKFGGGGAVSFAGNPYVNTFDPRWWGALPAAANNYAAIMAAWTALVSAGKGTLWIPDGEYTCLANLDLDCSGKTGITIDGPGSLYFPNAALSQTPVKIHGSSYGTTTTLSIAGVETDQAATVVSAAALKGAPAWAIGDMITMTSDENWSESDVNYKKGELLFLKSVPGANILALQEGLRDDYSITGKTVTLTRINKAMTIRVKRLALRAPPTAHSFGLTVSYAEDVVIGEVLLNGCEDSGIYLEYVSDASILNKARIKDTDGGGATPGYAYSLGPLAQHVTLDAPYSVNHRHGFTTGSLYPVWHVTILGGHYSHTSAVAGAVETHMNSSGVIVVAPQINDCYTGVAINNRRGHVRGGIITGVSFSGLYFIDDGLLGGTAEGVTTKGVRGATVGVYAGAKKPWGEIRGHDHEGKDIGGVALAEGFSLSANRWKVKGGRFKNITRNLISGSDCLIEGVETIDVRLAGTRIAYQVSNASARNRIRRCIARAEDFPGEMSNAVYVEAGCTDTVVEENEFSDYYTGIPILDLGTRTRFRRNYLNGRLMSKAVLGVLGAGAVNATLAGKVKTVNAIHIEINGTQFIKAATDNFWTMAGATTTAIQFRKVLLGIDDTGAAVVINGLTAATQFAALVPDWIPWNVVPVAVVEIPNNYADGGSLAGFQFRDYLGKYE